ncbi:dihydrofolate reductase family protein [Actinomarinicola tropica]|uniref:Pyrimidine reductase family protein n=1 Tax=Actinomarinicola tropica TaxID=2789776 RepID=A0A5Q2RP07_9ACTN|nr:dihydrofolate reductase family protein [Actinomarinicola tropica]QGG94935.1 pyrimidine reductase family protein [Actinomarinicola tropica]
MQRLVPTDGTPPDLGLDAAAIDPLIAAEARPGTTEQPWVVVNMVTSVDGATYVDGVSGPLGGDGDFAVFVALRAVADVVLAGSATVTAERYRPPMGDAARRARRTERGQAPLPRLAVVSNRGDIALDLPMFTDAGPDRRPVVLVADAATEARRTEIEQVADVLVAGEERVDVRTAVSLLGSELGARIVLCEGGATLNGLLLAADLVDEWCTTSAPLLVAGDAARSAVGSPTPEPRRLRLARVLEHDGELMLRYVRDRDPRNGGQQRA